MRISSHCTRLEPTRCEIHMVKDAKGPAIEALSLFSLPSPLASTRESRATNLNAQLAI